MPRVHYVKKARKDNPDDYDPVVEDWQDEHWEEKRQELIDCDPGMG